MNMWSVVSCIFVVGTFLPKDLRAEGDKGIGPVKEVTLSELNEKMAKEGREVFDSKCMACHKIEERYVGPALKDVTKRRTPEWILNMILNPAEMLEKNEAAKDLLGEYLTPMTFQNVTRAEAEKILEYFRAHDLGKWVEPKAEVPKKEEPKADTKKAGKAAKSKKK